MKRREAGDDNDEPEFQKARKLNADDGDDDEDAAAAAVAALGEKPDNRTLAAAERAAGAAFAAVNDDDDDGESEKLIYFCFGEHGVISWPVDAASCKTFAELEYKVVSICVAPAQHCSHGEDTKTHSYMRMPFEVSYDDVLCFLRFVDCDEGESPGLPGSPEYHMLTAGGANFVVVARMFEFFQSGKLGALSAALDDFLRAQTSFKSAVSCLAAYWRVAKRLTSVPSNILYRAEFELPFRLKMAVEHGMGQLFYGARQLGRAGAAAALGVEEPLLARLHPERCVLAGGGAAHLGCAWSQLPPHSDVDFFVLAGDAQRATARGLVNALRRTGRRVYTIGAGVVSAIGHFGVRRVQVILTTATSAEELVRGFDFPAVSAYYDGRCLHATVGAHYSWLTRKCLTNVHFRRINAARLLNLCWKGFEPSEEAIAYMRNTIYGWPVPEFARLLHHNSVPFLLPAELIPQAVQDANLFRAYKMSAIEEEGEQSLPGEGDGEDECQFLASMMPFNSKEDMEDMYTSHANVYGGTSLPAYLETCRISKDSILSKKAQHVSLHAIESDYLFQIPVCHVSLVACLMDGDDGEAAGGAEAKRRPRAEDTRNKVCIAVQNDALFNNITELGATYFCSQLRNLGGVACEAVPNLKGAKGANRFNAKYSQKTTQFYENGFPCSGLPQDLTVRAGKVLMRPAYLSITADAYSPKRARLHWRCARIFWSS